MANHDEKNKYAYLDQLSTEELRQLLCADIDSPVNGDDEAIFYKDLQNICFFCRSEDEPVMCAVNLPYQEEK